MAINVAGTNAIGDYLVSKIRNIRTLVGAAPPAAPAAQAAATSGVPASPATKRAELLAQVNAQNVANTQTLFGIRSANDQSAGGLPPLASQTPQQLAFVAIQSANIAAKFSNIATLFALGNSARN